MQLRSSVLTLVAMTIFVPTFEGRAEDYLKYKLKSGQSIGFVLDRIHLAPLWTKDGYLQKTKDLNPELFKSGWKQKITEGSLILLPVTRLPESPRYTVVNNEVFFKKEFVVNEDKKKIVKKVVRHTKGNYPRDIIINFYENSIPKAEPGSSPVIININIYENGETPQIHISDPTKSAPVIVTDITTDIVVEPDAKRSFSFYSGTHSILIVGKNRSNNATSKLISSNAFSLGLEFLQEYSSSYKFGFGAMISKYNIVDNLEVRIPSVSITKDFFIKAVYSLNKKINFTGAVLYKEKYFVHYVNTLELKIAKLPSVAVEFDYLLKKFKTSKIEINLSSHYDFSKKEDFGQIDSGLGYGLGFDYLKEMGKNKSLDVNIFYKIDSQNSVDFSQTNHNLGLLLKFTKLWGGEEN